MTFGEDSISVDNRNWYELSITDTAKAAEVTISSGLTAGAAQSRLAEYGYNELTGKKRKGLFLRFLEQFKDFMVLILLAAAVVSFIATGGHEWLDSVIILVIVVLNAILGVTQESRAEKSLEALQTMSAPYAKVRRDGKVVKIPAREVVMGDVVILEAGDYVPADLRIIESVNLKAEESALTGESVPVEKIAEPLSGGEIALGDRVNMLFSTSVITYGRGEGIAVATAMNTEVGKIAGMLSDGGETVTPLQRKMSEIGKTLGIVALIICAVMFGLGVLEGEAPLTMFMTAVSLAVAAIPEGLPAVVTIVLALGVQRMVKKHAIVKRLPAVETLGSAGVICSDKTGTLTQNRMTVVRLATADGLAELKETLDEACKTLLQYGALCNDSKLDTEGEKPQALGDPTETALVMAALEAGLDKNQLDCRLPRVFELPFDSDRKLMTTVHEVDGSYIAITKGAPDVLLERCTQVWKTKVASMDAAAKEKIQALNAQMADDALRVLAVAYQKLDALPSDTASDVWERDLTFVGLLGMIDPPRLEVKDSVALCRKAGIQPVMITGDHKATASAIARELGILGEGQQAITGLELNAMSQQELEQNVEKYAVYARVSPEHKVRIVSAWQARGKVVAMTGDGVNDAPALKTADIGCAMGITGTEVSKGAAAMILTDDNFATIVEAVKEGRGIFANIKKAIHFLLSCNVGEIVAVFFATLLSPLLHLEAPLSAIHILWINLVTDSFPALALGIEPVEGGVMDEQPRDPKKSVFSDGLGVTIGWQGVLIGILTLGAYILGYYVFDGGHRLATTMAFATLSITQLVHVFNVRSDKSIFRVNLFRNRYLIYAFICSLALLLVVMVVPALQAAFGIVALSAGQWLTVIGLALVTVVFSEIGKLLKRK